MAKDYLWIEGLPFPSSTVRDLRSLQDKFVVKDEDVIIFSYPKSGISWMREIINLNHTKGDPSWVQTVLNWERSPWIETQKGLDLMKNQKDPRIYISHLPIQLFPKSFFQSKAKAIYIMRNPRDVVVSGYHFYKVMMIIKSTDSFEEYFEWFLQGNVIYGSWFDHLSGWLQMKGKENFLLISYEELQQDLRASVERISQFLGMKLNPEELNSVLKNVSFQAMKENKMSNYSLVPNDIMDHSRGEFLRKGITGDWKNHFTVSQSEAFDKVYQGKMAGLPQGLFPWE